MLLWNEYENGHEKKICKTMNGVIFSSCNLLILVNWDLCLLSILYEIGMKKLNSFKLMKNKENMNSFN